MNPILYPGINFVALALVCIVLATARKKQKFCFIVSAEHMMIGLTLLMMVVMTHVDPAYRHKQGSSDYWANLVLGSLDVAVATWGFWNFHRGGQENEAERLANLSKQPATTDWPSPNRR